MTETTTPPPVHHYEEDFSRGQAFVTWLKAQYALYILVALLVIATITKGSIFWGQTNLTNGCCRCQLSAWSYLRN
jgi:ribose transport system permease protein